MKRLVLAAVLANALGLTACDPSKATGFNIPKNRDLKPGGVYVAYNLGCEQGCDQIKKGDLIQSVNGKPVATVDDVGDLADGQPHTLEVLSGGESKTVKLTATPKQNLTPIENAPPLWLVGAEELNLAPEHARRRLFGHASPSVMLVSSDGGILDGRQLYGKKRLMVYWDWGDREEEAAAVDFMQVLQKAQGDLAAKNVDIMFVHVRFPTGRKAAMNDSDLRAWQKRWTVQEGGAPLPEIPMYRFPNETEFNAARELGMEGSFTVFENLGQSPAIVLLNEDGIVRWHSEGLVDTTNSPIKDPEQATIIPAVEFALAM